MFLRRRVPENGPLKAAVIGAGVFGHHHATKYKALGQAGKGVELFAVADPNADMRAKAKAHHGCAAVADWRELLGKVDLVSICSPAITHAEIVRAFLNAGAHVLVEKPIATTMEEASELVALSRETGKVLSVGHQERFVFARTGLLDITETPLEITCWRQGSLDRPRRRCLGGAGSDDPRPRPGAHAGAGRGGGCAGRRADRIWPPCR